MASTRQNPPQEQPSSTPSHSFHSMHHQHQSRLFLLPAELRTLIYEHLLIQTAAPPPTTTNTNTITTTTTYANSNHTHPAILRTCRLAAQEGVPILYTRNTFLAHPSLLLTFASLLHPFSPTRPAADAIFLTNHVTLSSPLTSPTAQSRIRRVALIVRLDADPRFTAEQAERALSGLERLDVCAVRAAYSMGTERDGLGLLEGVRAVGSVRVAGSVGDGKYAAWLERVMVLEVGTVVGRWKDGDRVEDGAGRVEVVG